jgi:hypothetical protein
MGADFAFQGEFDSPAKGLRRRNQPTPPIGSRCYPCAGTGKGAARILS